MATPGEDAVLGVGEAAELLGMSEQMVRKHARSGRIPAYRLPGGRVFKFFRNELLRHREMTATPMAGEGDAVIDTKAVAELLDMDVQQVRKYAREKRIPAHRHPGKRGYEFSRSEVLQYVRSCRAAADERHDGADGPAGGAAAEI